jgi:hypothetical protein
VLRRKGAGAGQVDLLLPLTAGADPDAEAPYITAAQPSRPLPLGGWSAASVDVDLGEAAGADGLSAAPAVPERPA